MQNGQRTRHLSLLSAAVFAVALTALIVIALFPVFPRQLNIRVNDIAARTVRAPRSVTFESAYSTEQAKNQAAEAVIESRVFDPAIRTGQGADYNRTAAQVTQIRALPDEARRRADLEELGLSPRSVDIVLAMPEDRWQSVVNEARRVLDQSLSKPLNDLAVAEEKDGIDASISADFTADEALLTAELVRPLIIPTLAIDDARTQAARDAARAAVAPKVESVRKGDAVLSAGARVDEVTIERLRATDLLSNSVEWRNVIAVAIISSVAGFAIAGYVFVLQPQGISSDRHLIALALVTMLPLIVAKFYIPLVMPDNSSHFLAYVLPIAAAPLLIAALLDTHVAVVVATVMGLLIAFVSALMPDVSLVASIEPVDTFRLLLVYGLGPLAGIYLVHRADRLNRYFTAGIAVFGISYALLVATWFIDADRETVDLGWMALATGIGGVSSGVMAAGAFVTVGVLFGVTTRVQLMELSQLNAPLLRRLQDEAPGTFHHSVIVGNLAERAADLIGADALVTRVGCYYHDIGKVLQPGLYIENQMGGASPHEEMSPEESAQAIQQHVVRGVELAKRARLPARVQAFIPEHHGTRLVAYFYRKAAESDPDIDTTAFTYPGPRPQSRETAIVMLADSTEAVVRSSSDRSAERIDALVDEVIAERVAEGQLDDSDLTLRDLRTIAESFKATMRAVYHPRVQYPQPTAAETRRRMLRLPLLQSGADRRTAAERRRAGR